MVELRKRKTPDTPAPPKPAPSKKKSTTSISSKAAKDATASAAAAPKDEKPAAPAAAAPAEAKPSSTNGLATGDALSAASAPWLSASITTQDGTATSISALVAASKAGVVLFTYPKASTPGCTTQACLFRDDYTPLSATGLSIFGLSADSPKANTTFKEKQSLPYPLLCDTEAVVIKGIGMGKAPKGTVRGVVVLGKDGAEGVKVLAAEKGGPAATVEVVKGVVKGMTDGEKL